MIEKDECLDEKAQLIPY